MVADKEGLLKRALKPEREREREATMAMCGHLVERTTNESVTNTQLVEI